MRIDNQFYKFKLANTAQGSGPPVILVHGMGSSRRDWQTLTPLLVAAGYRVYAVDLLGHGDSPKPEKPEFYTVEAIYTAFESWIDGIDAPGPYHLVGHSLGGYLSIKLGLRQPGKVHTMSLIDPIYTKKQLRPILRYLSALPGLGIKLLPFIPKALIDTAMGLDPITSKQLSARERQQIADDIKRASPQILNIPRSVPDLTSELSAVQQPCQVIWGDKDLTLTVDSFPTLVSELPYANAQIIAGTRHQPHIGVPEVLNPLVMEFISTYKHPYDHPIS